MKRPYPHRKTQTHTQNQLHIDWSGHPWPDSHYFPHNNPVQHTIARPIIEHDLVSSCHPRIITGFTSLPMVLEFLSICLNTPHIADIRLLFGHDPTPLSDQSKLFRLQQADLGIKEYWLNRGISLMQCRHILDAATLLERNQVVVRISPDAAHVVHAKIFEGEEAITCGSSNFSRSGLEYQYEGNVRFTKKEHENWFEGTRQLAQAIWDRAIDYTQEFLALLHALLKVVDWQESVARGCHELLDGEWSKRYFHQYLQGDRPLWPSQEQGVAQSMWIIDQVGSVLIADATGSGKTRMGATLLRAIAHHQWRHGPVDRQQEQVVLVCPPSVSSSWKREMDIYGCSASFISQGKMSQREHLTKEQADLLQRAYILAADEAHNYLNPSSARTHSFVHHAAEHVILFTATPINKGARDLLMIIELLGADNFSDDVINLLSRLWSHSRRSSHMLTESEMQQVRSALQSFIVRRTKNQLNALIDREPDKYQNRLNQQCRYPTHIPKGYPLFLSSSDRTILQQIKTIASQLRGVNYIGSHLRLSPAQKLIYKDESMYIESWLKCLHGLAIHMIMEPLRSSQVALIERLMGTEEAIARCHLPSWAKSQPSSGIIQRLQTLCPPKNELHIQPPAWLVDPDEFHSICSAERQRYEQIASLALALSSAREEAKSDLLISLLHEHDRVLAFDSHLITLADIQQRLRQSIADDHIFVATSDKPKERAIVERYLDLESKEIGIIVLCSDMMSDGINLQGASAMVHLDMPSVMRKAEQRVGRIDRIDSPHQSVTIYWPEEPEEFALHQDDIFYQRWFDVAMTLGSNVPLPQQDERIVKYQEYHDKIESTAKEGEQEEWKGIQDTFAPIRALVTGEDALISDDLYKALHNVQSKVVSTISTVASSEAWAFFTIGHTKEHMPFWIYLDEHTKEPIINHSEISMLLRERLQLNPPAHELDEYAVSLLKRFLDRLHHSERQLLPLKKRRALDQMHNVLTIYLKEERKAPEADLHRIDILTYLLMALEKDELEYSLDYKQMADRWLQLIFPVWYQELCAHYKKPRRLKDIEQKLCLPEHKISTEQLEYWFPDPLPILQPLSERVVAAIIGVPPMSE